MQMKNSLTGACTIVDNKPSVRETFRSGDLRVDLLKMTEQRLILRRRLAQARQGLTRDDQDMNRRLRRNVSKGNAIRVFIDDVSGQLASKDLCEQRHTNSSLTGLGMMMGAYRFTRQPHRPMVD